MSIPQYNWERFKENLYQIKELKELHDKGILSDEEFKKAKEKILE